MTLHQTVVVSRKVVLGIGAGIGAIALCVLLFQLGVLMKNILFPAKIQPANHSYDKLVAIKFPTNATNAQLTYKLNTVSGDLPAFPDRVNIYPLTLPEPSLLNLNKAKNEAGNLGFSNDDGSLLPEKTIGETTYQWTENKGIKRTFTVDTLTFDFTLQSSYLSSLTVLSAAGKLTQSTAINTTNDFMNGLLLMPSDIDLKKTETPNTSVGYFRNPQYFFIQNGALVPTTSFLQNQVIRVDLYQKDLTYDLNTGIPEVTGGFKKIPLTMPILYPHPPNSTMNFLVASGQSGPQVSEAHFIHKTINLTPEVEATYPIKTPQEAFEEVKNGKAYIASYTGPDTDISLTNVYLTYYLGEDQEEFLMPIIAFEGENGFFAYVSAIRDEWIK